MANYIINEYQNLTWTEVNKPEDTLCGYTARELQSLIEENTQLHETIQKLQEKIEALEPFEKLFMEYVKNGHSGASN